MPDTNTTTAPAAAATTVPGDTETRARLIARVTALRTQLYPIEEKRGQLLSRIADLEAALGERVKIQRGPRQDPRVQNISAAVRAAVATLPSGVEFTSASLTDQLARQGIPADSGTRVLVNQTLVRMAGEVGGLTKLASGRGSQPSRYCKP